MSYIIDILERVIFLRLYVYFRIFLIDRKRESHTLLSRHEFEENPDVNFVELIWNILCDISEILSNKKP